MILHENRSFWQKIFILGKPATKRCAFGKNLVDLDCFNVFFSTVNPCFKSFWNKLHGKLPTSCRLLKIRYLRPGVPKLNQPSPSFPKLFSSFTRLPPVSRLHQAPQASTTFPKHSPTLSQTSLRFPRLPQASSKHSQTTTSFSRRSPSSPNFPQLRQASASFRQTSPSFPSFTRLPQTSP